MATPIAKTENTPPYFRGFFSLKWRALILLSLTLIAINAIFTLLQYRNLYDNFEQDRRWSQESYKTIIAGLITQSALRLQQLADIIPALDGLRQPLLARNGEDINRAFTDHWRRLQLEAGVETVAFFDEENRLLASWSDLETPQTINAQWSKFIDIVSDAERPETSLNCTSQCVHYIASPIFMGNKPAGALLLGVSLADFIVDFSRMTAADIGIVVPGRSSITSTQDLNNWGLHVVALTHSTNIKSVLEHAAKGYRLDQMLKNGSFVHVGERDFEVKLIPLLQLTSSPGLGYFVTVDDTTNAFADIRRATQQTILVSIAGLILSEVILLLILWPPLSRLRNTAHTLPLLAQSAFSNVRHALRKNRPSTIADEIDQLNESIINVSFQLEDLEQKVAERARALAQKMHELTRERDFVRRLLDTAQVVIVTQNGAGQILLTNKYAQTLTGYKEDELVGKSFNLFFTSAPSGAEHLQKLLRDVAEGKTSHVNHEAIMMCKDGALRTITWFHSHLLGETSGPAILSVGLDITDRKQAETRIAWLADHDPLTGLYNRSRFQVEFNHLIQLADRYNRSGALLFIDLDHLKYVNDTNGHQAGDAFIQAVANELQQLADKSNLVTRLGGDEFALVIPNIDRTGAINFAQTINERLKGIVISSMHTPVQMSASIGIALFPEHGETVDTVLANADLAVFQAKEAGRGRWHVFAEEEHVRERLASQVMWKKRIQGALARDDFVLYYQPIMNLATHTVSHYEVLLRMVEGNEVLTPAAFIQVAEKTGLIHTIDHFVLRTAVAHLEKIIRQGHQLNFAINLSAHALTDVELLPLLKHLITTHNIPANRLIFEITETAALADISAANRQMTTIREMGCRFALDDFGVGFTSFYYLRELPIDFIKIDGAFIQHIAENLDDQIMVKAMTQMARGFGKKTVAECVENLATMDLLKTFDVDYVQGYHIGRPSPTIQ